MADTSRAVFLSYASQDAAAAKRICEALPAAGIEVWFDQSEPRGGDAWDQKIRREIHDWTLLETDAARGEPDDGSWYYHCWLAALERLVVAKELSNPATLLARKEAWADAFRHPARHASRT